MKNISEAKTIEEIAEIRKYKNEADAMNNDRSSEIISNLYSSSSFHFVFELLQNAEDAKATNVEFFLKKDRLYFVHDGRPFNIDDIKSITNYGDSTKSQTKDKIGKFGIGFKSVFQITKIPEIYSPTYSFKIQDKNIPIEISNDQKNNKTTFVFPFKEQAPINILHKEFNDLDEEIILFLKNIKSITVYIDKTKKVLTREIDNNFAIITKAITANRTTTTFEDKYLFFAEPACTNTNFNIAVAYKCNEEGAIDTDQQTKFVNVFFPTQISYGLKFYINAPFETTPTRESIKSTSESETNNKLFEQLVELYGKSLLKIRNLNLITPKFLQFLPITWGNKFFQKTKSVLLNEDIIPSSSGTYLKAASLAFTDKGMISLISPELLNKLTGKKCFVSSEITYDKTRALHYFLKTYINIPEYNFSSLTKKFTPAILQEQSDEWLKQYYIKAIHYHNSEFHIFSSIPIIRTENNQHVCAKNKNGMPNVYICHDETLKPEQKIKAIFLQDNDCMAFFEKLDITEPDETTKLPIIFEKLDILKKDKIDEYFVWFDKLNEIYLSYKNQPEKQKHLLDEIRDKDILFDNATFLNNEITRKLYESHQLVDPRFKENTNELLIVLGKKQYFSIWSLEGDEDDRENFDYLDTNDAPYKRFVEYYIESCKIENFTNQISKLLFEWMLSLNAEYYHALESYQMRKHEIWTHKRNTISQAVEFLNHETWIIDKEGKSHKIDEFTISSFIELFNFPESIRTHDIINLLNFKSDIYDQLSEKDKKDLMLIKQIEKEGGDPEEILNNWRAQQPLKVPEKQKLTIEQPETDEYYSVEINDKPITYTGLSPSEIEEKNSKNTTTNYNTQRKSSYSSNSNLKAHGFRGEKIALEALFDKYENQGFEIDGERGKDFVAIKNNTIIEVVYHNDEAETYGYDIEIKENDKTIELIEVKSHTGGNLINISGTQWAVAKDAYENKTVAYSLYVIRKITDEKYELKTNIGNPYEGWVDGKIFATPVNIRI